MMTYFLEKEMKDMSLKSSPSQVDEEDKKKDEENKVEGLPPINQ